MEKGTRSNRVGDPFSASSVGGETMATELTELPKEMRGSRLDQSKLKTKVDLGLAEQMAVLKSQVDQFEQLVLSMGNKINSMSRVDSCGGASDTSSIYIYIPCAAWSLVLRKGPYFVHGSYMNAKIRPFVKNTFFLDFAGFWGLLLLHSPCPFSLPFLCPAHFKLYCQESRAQADATRMGCHS